MRKKTVKSSSSQILKGPERQYDEDSAIEALQRGFPHLIDHVRTGRSEFFTADQVTKFDIGEAKEVGILLKEQLLALFIL